MKPHFLLPNRTGVGPDEPVNTHDNNVVFVGANGSGKTRLGSWIETTLQNQLSVHRISAQRSLNLPDYAPIKNLEQAEKSLFFGRDDEHANVGQKNSSRWGRRPETHLLNDYEALLATLFAHNAKRDRDHTTATRDRQCYIEVPNSPIDIIIAIWDKVMPHRQLRFDDGKVLAIKVGQGDYHARDMSDGERVALYLIGQCLTAPDGSILVIDEPEIHLHRALMARLWDEIEAHCQNKLLIYITHDLDFASSRVGAKKFWIKDYAGGRWTWAVVPEIDEIPEDLTIEILGSRRNILFVEGEKGSIDETIFRIAHPDYHIVPRGGCEKVIESTKAIRASPAIHHLSAHGIVDRDYRTNDEIQHLAVAGIAVMDVAEAENLFCVEPLLRIAATHLALNPDQVVAGVVNFIVDELNNELAVQITNRAEREIQFRLNAYVKLDHTEQGLIDGVNRIVGTFDVPTIYQETETLYRTAIANRDLDELLKLYNRKSLSSRISRFFGLERNAYADLLLRLSKGDLKEAISNAIKARIPLVL